MTAVFNTDLLMHVLGLLNDLAVAQPGQGSGLRGTCRDVYDTAKRTLHLSYEVPLTAGNDSLKHFP